MKHEVICIVCPRGCLLTVDAGRDYAVSGNRCERGVAYGQAEVRHPVRGLTTTVAVSGAAIARAPVRSRGELPKESLPDVMAALRRCRLEAPLRRGDVVLADAAGSGVDIIVTRDLDRVTETEGKQV
ncbi:MAG: DUF1667 domain-containing protein [Bacillota bacterium]|nr:DUF1667 domain-containing protein [Bacillota bacterium]